MAGNGDHFVTADCSWKREFPRSRSGTSLPLMINVPRGIHSNTSSDNKVIPPLQIVWRGEEPLDKLHIAFKVKMPGSSFNDKGSNRTKESLDEHMEGHCAIGLEKLCKLALCTMSAEPSAPESHTFSTVNYSANNTNGEDSSVCVTTSVAQLLLRDGIPMHCLDAGTLQVCVYCIHIMIYMIFGSNYIPYMSIYLIARNGYVLLQSGVEYAK
jgi:hypothetical protein